MQLSYTSREQVEVYRFGIPVAIGVPIAALLVQTFLPQRLQFIDLPLLVTIFFAVARRNPIAGLLTGGIIGLAQDSLTHQVIGVFGIAKTVIGYLASSLGVKLDVDNPGSRLIMSFGFYLLHQLLWFAVTHGLVGQDLQIRWRHLLLAALINGLVAIPLFSLLDRFKQKV